MSLDNTTRTYDNSKYNKEIVTRIKLVMNDKGINNKRLAEDFNMTPQGVSNILTGYRQISADKIKDFCLRYGASIEYIMLGIGPMYKDVTEECLFREDIDAWMENIVTDMNKYGFLTRSNYYKYMIKRLLSEL